MKIILEAEVMDPKEPMKITSMYRPGYCRVRLKVVLSLGTNEHVFEQEIVLYRDEVQSVFDVLMKDLARNMKNLLIHYLEDKGSLERVPLMPVFERMQS